MNLLIFLIVFPFVVGLALVLPSGTALKRAIAVMANIVLGAVSIYLLVTHLDQRPAY
ncbi:MAG TPA: hypothetical protein VEM40_12110 [Nitrospirota bacterium]|nr:hypothetical protein [Nitrospirota bacterium]